MKAAIYCMLGLLMIGAALADESGTVTFVGDGIVTAQVKEFDGDPTLNAQQDVYATGVGMNGVYTWATDRWTGRSTGLESNLALTANAGYFTERNWADFGQMTGSGTGIAYLEVAGEQVSINNDYDRHQGYAITSGVQASASGNGWSIYQSQELLDTSQTFMANHYIGFGGVGSGSLNDKPWGHQAIRAQGISYNSDGGWGNTGYPLYTATGNGGFSETGYGSSYVKYNTMVMPGGGSFNVGATFASGFTYNDFDLKLNNGGI